MGYGGTLTACQGVFLFDGELCNLDVFKNNKFFNHSFEIKEE